MARNKPIKEIVYELFRHVVACVVVIAGIFVVDLAAHLLLGRDFLLWDRLPLKYLFHTLDAVLIVAFGYRGVREVLK